VFAIHEVRDLVLDLLRKEVKEMNIPDQSGKKKTHIGKIHYTVSRSAPDDVIVGSFSFQLFRHCKVFGYRMQVLDQWISSWCQELGLECQHPGFILNSQATGNAKPRKCNATDLLM
jgi:hypothetical protein